MTDILRDRQLYDLIVRAEDAYHALDRAILFADLDDLRDAADEAAGALHEAVEYLTEMREQQHRAASIQTAQAFQQLRHDVARRAARNRRTSTKGD